MTRLGCDSSTSRIFRRYCCLSHCARGDHTAGPREVLSRRNWMPTASVTSPMTPPSASTSRTKWPLAMPPTAGLQDICAMRSTLSVKSAVFRPMRAAAIAASQPAWPAPTTTTSYCSVNCTRFNSSNRKGRIEGSGLLQNLVTGEMSVNFNPITRKSGARWGPRLLAFGSDRVFGCFCDAELHNGLGLDLNGFAGLRIASHAGLAVRLHQTAEAGDDEHAILLGLFYSGVSEVIEERCRDFVVDIEFFGHVPNQLGLGHASCHETSSLKDRLNVELPLNRILQQFREYEKHSKQILCGWERGGRH